MSKIIQLLLGSHQDSSLAGWAVLAWSVYQALIESGYHDYKMLLLGIGIFFVLRFMNERVPGLTQLVADVLRQVQSQQAAIAASPVLQPGASPRPNQGTPLGADRRADEAVRRAQLAENELAVLRQQLAERERQLQEVQPHAELQVVELRQRPHPDALRTEL